MTKSDPLQGLRQNIDEVDEQLMSLLARRLRIVDAVIVVKRKNNMPATIPQRIEAVVDHIRDLAAAQHVPQLFAERLWRLLIAETIAYEETAL